MGKKQVSELADEFGVQPSQTHAWVKPVLDEAEKAFLRSSARGRKQADEREIAPARNGRPSEIHRKLKIRLPQNVFSRRSTLRTLILPGEPHMNAVRFGSVAMCFLFAGNAWAEHGDRSPATWKVTVVPAGPSEATASCEDAAEIRSLDLPMLDRSKPVGVGLRLEDVAAINTRSDETDATNSSRSLVWTVFCSVCDAIVWVGSGVCGHPGVPFAIVIALGVLRQVLRREPAS